jgi:hypothetical protein
VIGVLGVGVFLVLGYVALPQDCRRRQQRVDRDDISR